MTAGAYKCTRWWRRPLLAAVLVAAAMPTYAQDRQWGQDRSIVQVSPSVYRWGSDGQYGAYILTDEGIILVDGHYCPSGTVAWLKEELARRHDVPVRFVVLSHDHQDHICHTELFSDTAVTVGHRLIRPHIVRENRISAVPQVTFEDEMDLHLGDVNALMNNTDDLNGIFRNAIEDHVCTGR